MSEINNGAVSPFRLRVGVIMIILWWLPFWALAPYIANIFGSSDDSHLTATITTVIVIIQTIIGILGILIAGQQVKSLARNPSKKQALEDVWQVFRTGVVK